MVDPKVILVHHRSPPVIVNDPVGGGWLQKSQKVKTKRATWPVDQPKRIAVYIILDVSPWAALQYHFSV